MRKFEKLIKDALKEYTTNDNEFTPNKLDYLISLKSLIDQCHSNDLLFFKILVNYKEEKIFSDDENQENIMDWIELNLCGIDFLELVYARHFRGKVVMLIAIKSILGYDPSIVTKMYLDFQTINYLDSKEKIYSCLSEIIKDYDLFNIYYFKSYYANANRILEHNDNEFVLQMKPYIFKSLELLQNEKKDHFLMNYDHKNIFSVKKVSHMSIINMWNLYMTLNDLFYSIEDKKIYKKNGDKYEFFSEIDYLIRNVFRIFYFIEKRFDLEGFPIEKLISNHMGKAIKVLRSDAILQLPLLEKEDIIRQEDSICDDFDEKNTKKIYEFQKKKINYINKFKEKEEIIRKMLEDDNLKEKLTYYSELREFEDLKNEKSNMTEKEIKKQIYNMVAEKHSFYSRDFLRPCIDDYKE